jgi:Xaa-Pro aminopeptidase
MAHDQERMARIRTALARQGLDGLVCRLPENLVLLAGYWPVIGRSVVVIPAVGDPVLLAPAMEQEALEAAGVSDIRTFPVWRLGDPAPDESLRRLLRQVAADRRLAGRRIGLDDGFEDIAPTQKVLEPWAPAGASRQAVADAFGDNLADATPLLVELRARKTARELERIRVAGEIAAFGVAAFAEAAVPGRRDIDVAADVERAVATRGAGYRGAKHARAQAVVFSGVQRLQAYSWGFAPTPSRTIEAGDLVMLELGVVADGYYADLTRMRAAGRISAEAQEAYRAVREAQQAAVQAVRPGVAWAEVDAAARGTLRRHGYGDAFVHHTGHGLGFRYHEAIPFLHPEARGVLEEGMVTSIEPGIHGPGYGGIRIEDNVAVGADGPVILSECPRELR